MKTIAKTLALALLCALAGCAEAPAPDPLQDVLGGYILRGREGTFRLDRIEKIDSTTFRTEFEHRQNVFELKLREETRLYNDYVRQGKPRNAARHSDAILRTWEVMAGLDSLRACLEARLDEIAYYDYVFSGRVDIGNTYSVFQEAYASMTPALEVITVSTDRKDLHKAGGRAIPGYLQMLREDPEE